MASYDVANDICQTLPLLATLRKLGDFCHARRPPLLLMSPMCSAKLEGRELEFKAKLESASSHFSFNR